MGLFIPRFVPDHRVPGVFTRPKLGARRFQLLVHERDASRSNVVVLQVYARDPLVGYYYSAAYAFGRAFTLAEAVQAALKVWRKDRKKPHFRALSEAPHV